MPATPTLAPKSSTVFDTITQAPEYQQKKNEIMRLLRQELSKINGVRGPSNELRADYAAEVDRVSKARGRDLYYPFIGSGAGNGPFVELRDGSVKYDLITGIGVNFWGHGNIDFFEAEFDGLWGDVMQGNLAPLPDYGGLMADLLDVVGPKSRLKHVWLTSCGAIANENALKIIRQKKAPATRIFTFEHCFAGRTTALQEITDNAKYREGQPVYGEVYYLPFFDPRSSDSPDQQADAVVGRIKDEMARYPGRYAALEFEIVQGEGGFNSAPNEFFVKVCTEAKKAGLAIWVDEIQTFGRTGEIFAYQRFGLEELVDVVTIAKLLQTGAVLYAAEYNPKPGLVSGTFAGASSSLRAGRKAIELLKKQIAGQHGHVRKLEKIAISEFERLKQGDLGKHVIDYTVVGGMQAFTLFDGTLEQTKKFLFKLWDLGAIAFFCGHDPYRVRMLPPLAVMTEAHVKEVFTLIETAVRETAKEIQR